VGGFIQLKYKLRSMDIIIGFIVVMKILRKNVKIAAKESLYQHERKHNTSTPWLLASVTENTRHQ
jgi:hypothetical protein